MTRTLAPLMASGLFCAVFLVLAFASHAAGQPWNCGFSVGLAFSCACDFAADLRRIWRDRP